MKRRRKHLCNSRSLSHFAFNVALSDVECKPISESTEIPNSAGVYAIFDDAQQLQYIGMSKNVRRNIHAHVAALPNEANFVKV